MKPLRLLTLLLASTWSFAPILHAKLIDDWRIRHPLPSAFSLYNAAYGNGVYVIVGAGRALITSSDLQNWNIVNRPESLENVLFDGTQFVISGFNGDILTSTDGTNWTVHASGTGLSLSGIAYGDGRYVAAGQNGVTATSTNGTNWMTSATGDANWYFGVAYGAGRFVAVSFDADNYTATGSIATTTNGMDWTLVALPMGVPSYIEFYDLGYGNGRFSATGYYYDGNTGDEGVIMLTSTNGLSWSQVTDPDIPDTPDPNFNFQYWLDVVRYDGSRWVGAGDSGLVMTSNDGLDWSVVTNSTTTDFYGLAFGPLGTTLVGSRGGVFSSVDLSGWTQNNSPGYPRFYEIAFNGTQYLASGFGGILFTSEDGITWTQRKASKVNGNLISAAYGNGYWVVGSDANTDSRPLTVSTNGVMWDWPATLPDGFTACRGVAFGNGTFVALPRSGTNSLILSTNATDWSGTSEPWFTSNLFNIRIESGGGQFLAWNQPTPTVEVAVSSDGMSWETHDTGTTNTIISAAYGDGRWVLVGHDGHVVTTTNLTDWSEQVIAFGANSPVWLQGVAYGAGHWVIVGRDHQIWSSTDGLNWEDAFTTQLTGISAIFFAVTFDGSSFWTCGEQGVIYQSQMLTSGVSAPTLTITRTANPQELLLRIDGNEGEMWDLVYSPTIPAASWTRLSTITLTNDTHFHTVTVADGTNEQYFRLREPE